MPDRRLFILRMVTTGAVSVAAFGACSHPSNGPSVTPVRLEVTGPINHMVPEATGQVHALLTFSDQSTSDVTNATVWSSSVPAILTVSSTGVVHALTVGIVQIRGSYGGLSATVTVEVQSGS